jgi:hypothetical protein
MSNPNREEFKELTGLDLSELRKVKFEDYAITIDGCSYFYHPKTVKI